MDAWNAATVIRGTSGITVAAGIWLMIAPFVLAYAELEPALWNDLVTGALIAGLAGIRLARPSSNPGLNWAAAGAGAWLVAAPYVLDYRLAAGVTPPPGPDVVPVLRGAGEAASLATQNDIGVGLVVVILAVVSALAGRGVSRTAAPE